MIILRSTNCITTLQSDPIALGWIKLVFAHKYEINLNTNLTMLPYKSDMLIYISPWKLFPKEGIGWSSYENNAKAIVEAS